MNSIFSLKKEEPKSPWTEATMVMLADPGKSLPKRFLFDYNASEAIPITSETELGFILDRGNVFLADIGKVDKKKWNINSEEVNKLNKNKISSTEWGMPFKFHSFSNAKLYGVLEEELELSRKLNNRFSLELINLEGEVDFMSKEVIELLHQMNIIKLFMLTCKSSSSFDEGFMGYYDIVNGTTTHGTDTSHPLHWTVPKEVKKDAIHPHSRRPSSKSVRRSSSKPGTMDEAKMSEEDEDRIHELSIRHLESFLKDKEERTLNKDPEQVVDLSEPNKF